MQSNSKLLKIYHSITQGALHTLVIMFVLGMIANLYIEIPSDGNAWTWVFGHSGVIIAHIIIATVLLLVSVGSLVLAFMTRNRTAVIGSAAGLIFTLLAYYFGADFLTSGQGNMSSLLMAFGFIGAVISYGIAVIKTKI